MKQTVINKAYKTLMRIYAMPINVRVAHQVCVLAKALKPSFDSCYEMEQKLIEKYDVKVDDGKLICLPENDTPEATAEANERLAKLVGEWDELHNTEISLELSPLRVSFDDIEDVKLTPAEVESLYSFVEFV